jgi:hypothetical protein
MGSSPSKTVRALRMSSSASSASSASLPTAAATATRATIRTGDLNNARVSNGAVSDTEIAASGREREKDRVISAAMCPMLCSCCPKHTAAVLSNREAYFQLRRATRAAELAVTLERLPCCQNGFVPTDTLLLVARRYLQAYHGMPPRSADPDLPLQCVRASNLGLEEQRAVLLWVRHREAARENLQGVVPVQWYSPAKFAAHLVDLLEQLDRERLLHPVPAI